MKKFFKSFIAIAMSATMLVSGAAIVSAAEESVDSSPATASLSEGISPMASDEIYWMYRIKDGVMQKRRWNATQQVWVDPYWINVT